jgi:hypothetical protein
MTDYNAGDSLTEAVTACSSALATLQRLGCSDQADGPLTDAEATSYDAIAADTTRSDAWKLQQYAKTYVGVMSTLARRLTSAANAAGKQDADDASNVFGIAGLSGDVASLSIARRDAGDRVAAITDPSNGDAATPNPRQRSDLLAAALRNGDTTLARAVVQAAVESGDLGCVNQFVEAFPALNDAVERLWITQHRKSIGVDLTMGLRLAALKPEPIHSMMDYEIALIASGQTAAGMWNA